MGHHSATHDPTAAVADHQNGEHVNVLRLEASQLEQAHALLASSELASLKPEDVDMLTVLVIGNSSSRVMGSRMVTPRGYPGAALS